jgi:hypothetical protein
LEEIPDKDRERNSGGWYDVKDSGEYYITYYHDTIDEFPGINSNNKGVI